MTDSKRSGNSSLRSKLRGIKPAEIKAALLGTAEILEEYSNDPRGQSCLVLGFAGVRPIHVVLGWAERKRDGRKILRIITVCISQVCRNGLTREREG
jgi:hypothetical protein